MDNKCMSTHGISGYAPGSYWKGVKIVCGMCGTEIENPTPTSYHYVYRTLKDVWTELKLWWLNEPKQKVPQYPDFIRK